MVATTSDYTSSRYQASVGGHYDGVVRISVNGYYGTGALLYNGRAILTAAHLFQNSGTGVTTVTFETSAGKSSVTAASVQLYSGYDPTNTSGDLAIVWLSEAAPITADRYALYQTTDELGKTFEMVGYGRTGTGLTGALSGSGGTVRHVASNAFDALGNALDSALNGSLSWHPVSGSQLIADFDSGSTLNDALGYFLGISNTGLGISEGIIASGDSGGPAFIDGVLAGIATYTSSISLGRIAPDTDELVNSSFGEIAGWQRVSFYQQWIDQSLRASYPDAPTTPSEVKKTVVEGVAGTSYAYFLVQFSGEKGSELLSVDYQTRDGTATAGEDYFALSGTLFLYPGEVQAIVAVEVLGDSKVEQDETFYLDIFNPVGGDLGGALILTAVRTITNDDVGAFV